MTIAEAVESRFARRLSPQPNGCIVWTGGRRSSGYGAISVGGRMARTHRLAWQLANGPIPIGMFVCHHCDNPPCCNPEHLFLGTALDNNRDRHEKGRSVIRVGMDLGIAKLTDAQVIEIRARYAHGGQTHRALADEFGVTRTTIGRIVSRAAWRHLLPSDGGAS